MTSRTTIHHDEDAPRAQRYRVLREMTGDERDRAMARNPEAVSWWTTIESCPTEREARAYSKGYLNGEQRAEYVARRAVAT